MSKKVSEKGVKNSKPYMNQIIHIHTHTYIKQFYILKNKTGMLFQLKHTACKMLCNGKKRCTPT